MITKAEAKELVSKEVCGKIQDIPYDDEIVIIDEATMEMSWGWVFFYTSKKYHETNNFQYAIAGNAPIFVEKETGKLMETGTAHPTEYYIENYERSGNPNMEDRPSCDSADEETRVIDAGWFLLWAIVMPLIGLLLWIVL